MVRKGDLLFVIDPRPHQAGLLLARSKLLRMSNVIGSAMAEVKVREAQLDQASDVVRRYQPLLKTEAIETLAVDTARTAVQLNVE